MPLKKAKTRSPDEQAAGEASVPRARRPTRAYDDDTLELLAATAARFACFSPVKYATSDVLRSAAAGTVVPTLEWNGASGVQARPSQPLAAGTRSASAHAAPSGETRT